MPLFLNNQNQQKGKKVSDEKLAKPFSFCLNTFFKNH